jgi:hypothetical protein
LFVSVLSFAHTPLQTLRPAPQQTPDKQELPVLHTCPQPPQLLLLVLVFTHIPPQQPVPFAQTLPQLPQWLLSVCSLTHVPLQSDCPEGHVHALPEHVPLLQG